MWFHIRVLGCIIYVLFLTEATKCDKSIRFSLRFGGFDLVLAQVNSLIEDVEVTSRNIQLLRQDVRSLEKQINQTARTSQIQFMETGLEVEMAREVVLRQVAELAGNLSKQRERFQEMDVDLDYVYSMLYKDNSSSDCGCKSLRTALARLEGSVANVTELANKNRQALEEDSEGMAAQWDVTSDWEPAVQVVQQDLQQVPKCGQSYCFHTIYCNKSIIKQICVQSHMCVYTH